MYPCPNFIFVNYTSLKTSNIESRLLKKKKRTHELQTTQSKDLESGHVIPAGHNVSNYNIGLNVPKENLKLSLLPQVSYFYLQDKKI